MEQNGAVQNPKKGCDWQKDSQFGQMSLVPPHEPDFSPLFTKYEPALIPLSAKKKVHAVSILATIANS